MVALRTRARSAGFTIIEILVAIVVLGLAFVGILGLLVASTRQAGQVVEDTFAASLARSVHDAIRVGVRDHSFAVNDGTWGTPAQPKVVRGFILIHEGVDDQTPLLPLPGSPDDVAALGPLRGSDQTIFVPLGSPPGSTGGGAEEIFVFPRPNGAATDNAGSGVDNYLANPTQAVNWDEEGTVPLDIKRTYALPPDPYVTGAVTGPTGQADSSSQYSFAVVMQRAAAPPITDNTGAPLPWSSLNNQPPGPVARVDGLYEFRILVFRNFEVDVDARGHRPVQGGEYIGLIAIGP